MSDSSSPTPIPASGEALFPKSRVANHNGVVLIESGMRYVDGYNVLVEWSDEDAAWLARLSGSRFDRASLGTGASPAEALCALCCALAATVDSLTHSFAAYTAEAAALAPVPEREASALREAFEEGWWAHKKVAHLAVVPGESRRAAEERYPSTTENSHAR